MIGIKICSLDKQFQVHVMQKKVQVGKDQEKAQSEKDSHSKNRGGKKPNQQSGTHPTKHIASRMSSYFPNRWPLSYLNLTKNMKTYIRRQQHKKKTQKEPPQKYRLGTISNTKLLAGLNRFYRIITYNSAVILINEIVQESFDVSYKEKVQVGKDQEKAQSEKDSHSKNRGGKKPVTLVVNFASE